MVGLWVVIFVNLGLWRIGVDFVNKEDADLLILVGVCWVQIYGYADLFLGLILVGVC